MPCYILIPDMAVITGSGVYWGVTVSLHEGVTMDKKV